MQKLSGRTGFISNCLGRCQSRCNQVNKFTMLGKARNASRRRARIRAEGNVNPSRVQGSQIATRSPHPVRAAWWLDRTSILTGKPTWGAAGRRKNAEQSVCRPHLSVTESGSWLLRSTNLLKPAGVRTTRRQQGVYQSIRRRPGLPSRRCAI